MVIRIEPWIAFSESEEDVFGVDGRGVTEPTNQVVKHVGIAT